MAILPDFTLPSNPEITVRLHEATVSDAIDFSDVDPSCEEEATTLFLERLQEKDKYSDPKKWTAQDRRYALFCYHINTTDNKEVALKWTCEECSRKAGHRVEHTVGVPLIDILNEYEPINGKPVRDVIHDGHAILVHPLLGADCELLEKIGAGLDAKEAEMEGYARKERAQLTLMRLLCCIDIPGLSPNKDATEQERRAKVEEFILKMPVNEYVEFQSKIFSALSEMRHGLRTIFNRNGLPQLETPPVFCPENEKKEGNGIRLQYPFRSFDYIPHI